MTNHTCTQGIKIPHAAEQLSSRLTIRELQLLSPRATTRTGTKIPPATTKTQRSQINIKNKTKILRLKKDNDSNYALSRQECGASRILISCYWEYKPVQSF